MVALDGNHVVMQECVQGSLFYNYKGSHSIILMVLAEPRYEIIWCHMGVNRQVSVGAVWNQAHLCDVLEMANMANKSPNALTIARLSRRLSPTNVGDDALALHAGLSGSGIGPFDPAGFPSNIAVCERVYFFKILNILSFALISVIARQIIAEL